MSERKSWIDICKGIAIILVVMGHVESVYRTGGRMFETLHSFIYSFHMPLFLLISGYLSIKSFKNINVKSEVRKKVLSYGIPYVVFSLIYWVIKFIGSAVVHTPVDVKDLLLIPIFPISFMWYIYALLMMFLLTMLVFKICGNVKGSKVLIVGSFILYVVWGIFSNTLVESDSWVNDLIFADVCKTYIWYALGVVCGEKIFDACEKLARRKGLASIIVFLLYSLNIIVCVMEIDALPIFYLVWAMTGSIATIVLSMLLSSNRLLEYLGVNSLPIYVLHGALVSVVQIVIAKLIVNVQPIMILLLCTLLGVLVPLGGYRICSKVRFLDGLFYPNKYFLRD